MVWTSRKDETLIYFDGSHSGITPEVTLHQWLSKYDAIRRDGHPTSSSLLGA